jgi:signal transduction histidine kinase
MRRIDGLAVVVTLIAVVAAPIGGYFLAIGAIRPLTEFTRVASTLAPIKLGQRLPVQNTGDELDVLSQTINKLLDRIDKHLQRRRDSLANSAHELRSPLAAIRSSVEVALNDQRSAAEYEELLLDIIEQCEGLESLVNQLLLLAETEDAGARESFELVSWSDLVMYSVDVFRAAAEVANVELAEHIEPGILVRGNRQHLRQVINNLLDNAIKYTPGGGSVSVHLTASDAHEAVLRVMDTGVGIPAEDLPRVCERFFRGDKAHRRQYGTGGTGLGLSICQSVVEAHGGTIKVDSHLGDGTTVTVSLPLGTRGSE